MKRKDKEQTILKKVFYREGRLVSDGKVKEKERRKKKGSSKVEGENQEGGEIGRKVKVLIHKTHNHFTFQVIAN